MVKENTYYLDDSYDPADRMKAFETAIETDKLALGVIYLNPKPTFEEKLSVYSESKEPLFMRERDLSKIADIIESRRGI